MDGEERQHWCRRFWLNVHILYSK
uniref:Uncharacterized protein n=1 Tax=Arundo donax TaxID=35708 RepID=A0A0A9B295_ARUDO